MNINMCVIASAYLLDILFGDPQWLPHPVRMIGSLINKLEKTIYPLRNKKIAGVIMVIAVVSLTFAMARLLITAAAAANLYLGYFLATILMYTALSIKDLKDESMAVFNALKINDIDSARKDLSMIVGRDTQGINEKDVIRATVETVAENIVDGIVSPLFYAFIGGVPLAMAFKAINTMDSMIGYKNERYRDFGWAAARLDDIANFIPARLTALIMPVAVLLTGKQAAKAWHMMLRDGQNNPSPNSGIAEAAVAGALGIQLGGLNYYNSVPSLKPLIGDKLYDLDRKHIQDSIRIAYAVSFRVLCLGILLARGMSNYF